MYIQVLDNAVEEGKTEKKDIGLTVWTDNNEYICMVLFKRWCFYCERHLRRSIGGGLKGRSWKETPGNQVRLNDMYLLFKKYTPKEQHIEPSIFIKKCIDKGGSFIFSKNMCLQFFRVVDLKNCSDMLIPPPHF